MKENLANAYEELKRADHLIYVSLKYTRTVDVLKSVIDRLITTYDYAMLSLLKYYKSKKKIDSIPDSPIARALKLKGVGFDAFLHDSMDFYLLMRKISKADFTRAREFRRHVTMTVVIDGGALEINIDVIGEYFDKTKEFLAHVKNLVITEKGL